ncbi:hypothetical protein K440DRAFT_609221 [Wilcoxina mikolae CBS 423.85]|nr:hypothetical protein K440DRAFT_609221 [Wilcoxina mikolae CBS 423.85]
MVLLAKPALGLALALLNLLPAAAAADSGSDLSAVLQEHPEFAPLAKNGGLAVAYVDPNTHKVVKQDFGKAKNEKRAWYDDNLTRLLKQKRAYDWCEAYCAKPKPYTAIKVVYATTTVCGYGDRRCIPSTETVETTTTEVAATTVTSTVETTSTVATTTITSTVTETITLAIPSAGATRRRRALALPTYLRGYRPPQISSACYNLLPRPTTTLTYTRTRTIRRRDGGTTTTTTTTTATSTPSTTTTTTILTTHTESATTTTTVTVCAQATSGISGIAVAPPGQLQSSNAGNPVQCCGACYAAPGCVGWAFLGSGFCFYGIQSPPNSPPVTPLCPFGRGGFTLGTGGPVALQGGPGPCMA